MHRHRAGRRERREGVIPLGAAMRIVCRCSKVGDSHHASHPFAHTNVLSVCADARWAECLLHNTSGSGAARQSLYAT